MIIHRFIPFLAALLTLTGCQGLPWEAPSLSVEEVIHKNQQATQSSPNGARYKLSMQQKFTFEEDYIDKKITQIAEKEITTTLNPSALHMTGTLKVANGETLYQEIYQIGEEIYLTLDGTTWNKSNVNNLSIISTSDDFIQQLEEILYDYKGDLNKILEIEETEKEFIVTLNVSNDRQLNKYFKKIIAENLAPALELDGLSVEKKSGGLLQKYKQVFHFNKKTFKNTRMIEFIILELPLDDGRRMKLDQISVTTLTGDYTGTIDVPKKVQKNARDLETD